MNNIKKYGFMLMAGVALLGAASCSDPDGELTSVEYSRYFAPTDVTMRIVGQTSIEVEFTSISKAETYEIEFYQGETVSGSPVRTVTIDGTGKKANTVQVDGFASKTTYIAQVRATGSKQSNWGVSDKFVTTKEEQILLDSQTGDITETSIKVRWTAGSEVTKLTYAVASETEETPVETLNLSADDINNAFAVISGLTAGTEYKVVIYKGDEVRGKMTYGTTGTAPKPVVIEGIFIDYQRAAAVTEGITIEGTTVMKQVKIHEDTEKIDCIQLANSYASGDALNGNDIKLTVEGGFKAGDKVTISGFFNNADDTKNSAADIFVVDPATGAYKVLFTTKKFVNGKLSPADPAVETYVLTEDAETLYIGRNGNTGTNICLLQVERPAGGAGNEPTPGPAEPVADPFAAEGTLLTFAEKNTTYTAGGLTLTIDDTDAKLAVDDNTAYFGASAATCQKFTKRLKTGAKTAKDNAKNFMTIEVPGNGTLYFAVRTGSNSATDRNIIVSAGDKELVNKILLEAEALQDQTIEGEANPQKVYAPVSVDVEKGTYTISYPVGSINFYAIKFIAK